MWARQDGSDGGDTDDGIGGCDDDGRGAGPGGAGNDDDGDGRGVSGTKIHFWSS